MNFFWRSLVLFTALLVSLGSCATLYDARLGVYTYTHQTSTATTCPTMPVYLDKDFSLQDQLAIDDALNQWNYALNGYYQFKLISTTFDMAQESVLKEAVADRALVIFKIKHDNPILLQIKSRGEGTVIAAFTVHSGGHLVYVVRDNARPSDDIGRIVLHELGHTLGADDVHQTDSLMNWKYIDVYAQCVDYATLQQIAPKLGLPLEHLNYCTTHS